MTGNSLALASAERKICSKCCTDKPVSEFYAAGGKRAGFRPICKPCFREPMKLRPTSPERRAAYSAIYRKRDRNLKFAVGLSKKPYQTAGERDAKAEIKRAKQSKILLARAEQRAIQSAQLAILRATPEAIAARLAKGRDDYYKKVDANPDDMRIKWRRAKHIRRLKRKDQSDGTLDREGFTGLYDQAKSCLYCSCRLTCREPTGWRSTDATLDHLVPISKGGVHGLVNVVVCCSRCNFSKHDLMPFEWVARLPDANAKVFRRLYAKRYGVTLDQPPLL